MRKTTVVSVALAVAVSLPFYGHTWNLLMHIIGAVLFMGNIVVSAAWLSLARRSGNGAVLGFAARGVVRTDALFTAPGAVLLLLNGGILGTEWFKNGAVWLMVSISLFVVSGILWLAVLIPLQKRLVAATSGGGEVSADAEALVGRWFRVGGIATLLPLAVLVLMVFKPA